MISLASGYGNFALPPEAAERVMTALQASPLPLGPAEGLPALREALVARFQPRGGHLTPAQVVVTPGGKAALFALLKTVLQPGDEVLLPTPNWFGFEAIVRHAGGTLRPLPLTAADNYALRPEQLAAAITPRTRVLLFSNPNNPTGRVYSPAELEALLAVTRRHPGLFVLADEIYDLITFDSPTPSLLTWPDPLGQHLVVNGFSKSLALPGWGIGYLVAPPAIARACANWQFTTGAAVAAPAQLAATAVTEAAPAVARTLLTQLAPTRELLLAGLAALPGLHCPTPTGTYYAFPDCTAYLATDQPPAAASAALVARIRTAGVDVVDGATCGAPGFLRLSYAVPEPRLREALQRLGSVFC